jgi:flagellar hook-length control protein FliK
MTLDGPGNTPIEVSISIQGNEASVAFRTDQPAARHLLEGAVSHLEDMLARQGLSLAGVSVGSSGQGASHADQDNRASDGRKAKLMAGVQSPGSVIGRASNTGNRVIDLFV